MFSVYFEIGYGHILDWAAYDHILFVVTLCAIFAADQWKRVLVLVTAFTLGHSLTLALSTTQVINVSAQLVEILIPITIILTAVYNLLLKEGEDVNIRLHYGLAAFFGLIHGLGFSNYLKAILGGEEELLVPLLSFNLGVEVGQILVVLYTLCVSYLLVKVLNMPYKWWVRMVSGLSILVSFYLLFKVIQGG